MVQMNADTSSDEDDIDRDIEITSSPGKEELLPILECPICLSIPTSFPIKTCIQGHIICSPCARKVKVCPLCRKKIGIGRNFFAEEYLRKSVMKCPNTNVGCTQAVSGDDLKRHVQDCRFRPIRCQICMAKSPFNDFENHLVVEHRISQWDINDGGDRIILLEKQKTRRYNIELYEWLSREFLYKTLFALFVISFFLDCGFTWNEI